MKNIILLLITVVLLLHACKQPEKIHDATGTFEATEVIVSAEANGKILMFDAEEGATLKKDQLVARVDVQNLGLQKAQVEASIGAVGKKKQDATPQVNVLKQQMSANDAQVATLQTQLGVLEKESKRLEKLFNAEAATEQQVDDIDGKISVLQKQIESAITQKTILARQIESTRQTVAIQNRGLTSEREPLRKKIDQIEDQMKRGEVRNPRSGTIITKYAQEGEFAAIGKPLYKIADLSIMTFRAYISGDQLGAIKPNQTVTVMIDQGKDNNKTYNGTVTWISDKAEFTPKTIQTKNERANLVYAIKVKVENDGYLKIGMYGELDIPQS